MATEVGKTSDYLKEYTMNLPANLEDYSAEELLELLADLKLEVDEQAYFEKYLKVQPREGGGVKPFVLNGPQKLLSVIFDEIKSQGRLIRVLILKGRRMGVSTYISGRFYRKVSRTKSCYALQITHEPQASEFIFRMVKRFHNLSPKSDRPQTLANNARLLEFNNPDGTGLDSAFRVATAGKEDVGSGQGVHLLHGSEMPKWPAENAESLIKAVLPCVPPDPDTEIMFEGTANGVGGEFHARFYGARYRYWVSKLDEEGKPVVAMEINEQADSSNDYTAIFLPWFVFELNRKELPPGFLVGTSIEDKVAARLLALETFTEEELDIKEMYGLDWEQLYWRKFTIANEFKGDVWLFNEAHPDTVDNAFVSSGVPYFHNPTVMMVKKNAPPPIARYEYSVPLGQWIVDPKGRLKVWKEPKPGKPYLVSADVSEGLVAGDFSSADVIDHLTGEQVAQWHGKAPLKEYAQILMGIGKRYNTAYLAPERNNAGVTVVQEIFDAGYPRIHMEMVPEPPNKMRKRYGWVTSSSTRLQILDNLKTEVNEGTHGINCAETCDEMLTFKRQEDGKYEADKGMFDDRCMSLAIGKHLRKVVPVPDPPRPSHIRVQGGSNTPKKRGGWGL